MSLLLPKPCYVHVKKTTQMLNDVSDGNVRVSKTHLFVCFQQSLNAVSSYLKKNIFWFYCYISDKKLIQNDI